MTSSAVLPYNPRIPRRRSVHTPIEPHAEEPQVFHSGKRKFLFFFTIGFSLVFVGYLLLSFLLLPVIGNAYNQVQYGSGRISNFDFNVGHGGTSHFIAQMYRQQVIVVEIDEPEYKGTVYTFSVDQMDNGKVVSIIMQDVNHDGKPDLIVSVEGDIFSMVLYNTGTIFTGNP
ncbi:MAG TPA: hypothetical protein VFV38_32950 [Ktedonobacteraceae bacterium]|nr:hypothetical protein [Ktedonobacteraceae bacterium]